MESVIAHLGFIQGIISRMGSNSFILKGWSVTLVAALFALAVKDADKRFMLLAYFPACVFWWLDCYFLHQEALFRKLYEKVAAGVINSTHFTLDPSVVRDDAQSMFSIFFSKTLLFFHGVVIIMILFAMYVLGKG